MRLTDTANKIKVLLMEHPDLPKDVFFALLVVLVGGGGFALGRLSVGEEARRDELKIVESSSFSGAVINAKSRTNGEVSTKVSLLAEGMYVGSKTGSIYHLPWCAGAKRIRDENKIWFMDKHDAEQRGYKPAGNCKGI